MRRLALRVQKQALKGKKNIDTAYSFQIQELFHFIGLITILVRQLLHYQLGDNTAAVSSSIFYKYSGVDGGICALSFVLKTISKEDSLEE
jgi:hypothetical protein